MVWFYGSPCDVYRIHDPPLRKICPNIAFPQVAMAHAWFKYPSIGLARTLRSLGIMREVVELLPVTVLFKVESQNICQQLGEEGKPGC